MAIQRIDGKVDPPAAGGTSAVDTRSSRAAEVTAEWALILFSLIAAGLGVFLTIAAASEANHYAAFLVVGALCLARLAIQVWVFFISGKSRQATNTLLGGVASSVHAVLPVHPRTACTACTAHLRAEDGADPAPADPGPPERTKRAR